MAHATPLVQGAVLWVYSGRSERGDETIVVESAEWWRWLDGEGHKTFRFESATGSFTARREEKRSGCYWYAYRKYRGKLYKTYLGKSKELRQSRLEDTADLLTNLTTRASSEVNEPEEAIRGTVEDAARLPVMTIPPMERPPLLATKLYQPPTRAGVVTRAALLRRLDASLQCRLTLVVAPAGFGKTTLLSEWSSSRSDVPHAWLSLDKGDNDPMRFWGYVLASLQRICPPIGEYVLPLFYALPASSLEAMLTELVNALSTLEGDVVLILDDYHLLTTSSLHQNIAFLLEHAPPRFHLALASRTEPPLTLARLRARGQLSELHAAELRFTAEEVTRFLKQVMKLDVAPEDVKLLEEQTEGWIAAIQLVALSLQASHKIVQGHQADLEKDLQGQHRYIIDYLTEEVLLSQPEYVRTFLLQTSLLERFNVEVCNAITQRSDSAELLEYLAQANLFLVALDEEGDWWRYHHLFAEFLRHSLRRSHPEWIAPVYKRASTWFEERQLMSEAIHYAFASEDIALTARLLQACALDIMARGEITTLLGWLGAFPASEMYHYPFLHAAFAGALTGIGQLERAEEQLQLAQQAIQDLKARGERREEWRELDGLYLACAGILASFQGDVPKALEFSQRALDILSSNQYVRCIVAAGMGNAYLLTGDYARAYEAFEEAIRLGLPGLNLHASLASMTGQGCIQFVRGKLYQAIDTFWRVVNTCKRYADNVVSTLSLAYVFQGEVLYEWNDVDGAERAINDGLELGKTWNYVGVLAYGYAVLGSIKQARGENDEALEQLERGMRVVDSFAMPQYKAMITAIHARVCLGAGKLSVAKRWADALEIHEDAVSQYPHDVEYVIYAQVRMAEGRLDEVVSLLTRILPCFEEAELIFSLIQGLSILACAFQLQGKSERALQTLRRALTLAEPEEFTRSFVDQGEVMYGLLRQVAASGQVTPYVYRLLAAFQRCEPGVIPGGLLSERELAVLRLIAAGRSNQHIARDLVVALSTVKTHLNNIYVKLGVHSRTQAVARAKELRLLS